MPERPPSAQGVGVLLGQLCVQLGFCLDPDEIAHLVAQPPATVDEFTEVVMTAEGLGWPLGGNHRPAVRKLVTQAFHAHSPFET